MRFMVIVKATKGSEAGVFPSEEILAEMGKFNEELAKVPQLTPTSPRPRDLCRHCST
jgi:hypothetical protein